jgi:hypothetical protein
MVATSCGKPFCDFMLLSVQVSDPSALGPLSPTRYMISVLSRCPTLNRLDDLADLGVGVLEKTGEDLLHARI